MAKSSPVPPLDIELLPSLSIDALRALWALHMGRTKMPPQKRLLVRELAWRMQERAHGGFDAATRRLLNAAVRAVGSADAISINTEIANGESAQQSSTRKRGAHGSASQPRTNTRGLPNATRLTRVWRGNLYEVHILDGGNAYRYCDKIYNSLTEIACEITGTRWSGPRFFGLTTRSRVGGSPS